MTQPFVEENFRITLLRLLENAFVKLYLLLWYDPIISPLMQKNPHDFVRRSLSPQ